MKSYSTAEAAEWAAIERNIDLIAQQVGDLAKEFEQVYLNKVINGHDAGVAIVAMAACLAGACKAAGQDWADVVGKGEQLLHIHKENMK